MEAYLPKGAGERVAVAVLGISALYALSLVVHRLFFSPIAKFPGPKIAAVTSWYELYYDVVKKGKYLFEIEKMHDKYGMRCSFPKCHFLDSASITAYVQSNETHNSQTM